MNVTNIPQTAAGLSLLKAANRQPELALELLTRTMNGMAGPELQVPKVEPPASIMQATVIDLQA